MRDGVRKAHFHPVQRRQLQLRSALMLTGFATTLLGLARLVLMQLGW